MRLRKRRFDIVMLCRSSSEEVMRQRVPFPSLFAAVMYCIKQREVKPEKTRYAVSITEGLLVKLAARIFRGLPLVEYAA